LDNVLLHQQILPLNKVRKTAMTISNSSMFTSTIFGNSSGLTAADLTAKSREAQEAYLKQDTSNKIESVTVVVPSNQQVAKDN